MKKKGRKSYQGTLVTRNLQLNNIILEIRNFSTLYVLVYVNSYIIICLSLYQFLTIIMEREEILRLTFNIIL